MENLEYPNDIYRRYSSLLPQKDIFKKVNQREISDVFLREYDDATSVLKKQVDCCLTILNAELKNSINLIQAIEAL